MTAISLVTVGQAEEDKQGVYGRSHAYNLAHSTYCDLSVIKSGQKEFIYFLLLFENSNSVISSDCNFNASLILMCS